MKVSYNWLKEYVTNLPQPSELAEVIGAQLGAVEEIVDLGKKYDKALVVEVKECSKLEGSDHLSLCYIDDNGVAQDVERRQDGLVQVLCGAPNVQQGLKVVWLPPGATVPSSYGTSEPFVLGARKMLGHTSNGMLASPRELGISDEHNGILELPADAPVGTSFAEAYGLNDQIIDIENKMFTHRPDCFGLLGVAREVAGITRQQFQSPEWYVKNSFESIAGNRLELQFTNELPGEAPRFMLLPMSDVTVGPSPLWLQTLLLRAGMRPLNNVVDITNYIMLLTAQPTHAYDYDKLAKLSKDGQAHIVVRNPHTDEKIHLLNGKKVDPRQEAILICTDQEPIGIAGIMGGASTEVDAQTKNIILEVANFDMFSVRRTSMAHGLFTDALTRFNKGQSPLQNAAVMSELARLMQELTGAQPAGQLIDDNHAPAHQPVIKVDYQFVNDRLGLQLTPDEMAQLLRNVEMRVEVEGDQLTVHAPFWRTDLALREDIVEEVGRLYGFDHLPLELPTRTLKPVPKDPLLTLKEQIRGRLAAAGANEVLTYSFVHGDLLKKVGQNPDNAFKLSNALSPDLQYLRPSLMPSLLEKIHPNIKAGHDEFVLFELGKGHVVHAKDQDQLPAEDNLTALVVAAADKLKKPGAAYHQAQKYLQNLLQVELTYKTVEPNDYDITKPYDLSRAAYVYAGDTFLGIMGEFRASVRKALKLPVFCAGFELDTKELLPLLAKGRSYQALPRFPAVGQDVCLKVPVATSFGDLEQVVLESLTQNKPEDTRLETCVLDIYQRSDDPEHKQITFSLQLASYQKTLTGKDMSALVDTVVQAAKEKCNAEHI
ncbi:phenylalanine--tRNA ligase subunit beta [Candidatus Saccharibacteria bacterium]|nr:phenylalanine--tRNA ligase subunit beta [Candidatus Saccharibacteria bacterium]